MSALPHPLPHPLPRPARRPATTPPRVDPDATFLEGLRAHRALFDRLDALGPDIARAATLMSDTLRAGRKLMLMGNGGSAADCQHLAAEFTGRFSRERAPLAAVALTTDSSALTCIGNDYGFEQVFSRQVAGLGAPGDCVIGISTSGNSPNVLRGLAQARQLGMTTIGLSGRDGGAMRELCDLCLVVPHSDTARIQEAHIFIGHTWCALVEQALLAP
ncbi:MULTISPECIES: D-sedoheptulose 7-phosphate isomerase [unclassified Roseateles]|uniref:D-sedoheptulose 7-phosphate isomerase n=1 Tax=unclassified Roseateles TaxID=2626991 RepID=UPI0016100ED0|nr:MULTISPECIES: D-sedoheptulose 7-phosphate isomerase [unclassified Roseateles]MBB3281194.1 D-sedoheptulose 7-phosphate isomerase [Mitsuaria sp. BK037]MBB3293255.1 D-sedoheptulose 7-phosphate isomerase [Mitsuaria sp. BK041]MBB3362472.1 D-sedoheptulose 7-phosphate isomerase [Mitsuaria sp. BK045]